MCRDFIYLNSPADCHIFREDLSIFLVHIRAYIIKFSDKCMLHTVNKNLRKYYTKNYWHHSFKVSCIQKNVIMTSIVAGNTTYTYLQTD